jgi:hypothetical protein
MDSVYWSKVLLRLIKGRIPGQLVIQITDRCNAACPQCGMRATESFGRSKLSGDEIKRILDKAAQNGVQAISFTGGEPLLYLDELVGYIRHAGTAGIRYIRTGTNGFLFRDADNPRFASRVHQVAETLANTPLRNFWISLDSAIPAVHESMRGLPGVVAGIEKALPIFHEYGIYPTANLGINRNIAGASRNPSSGYSQEISETDLLLFYKRFREAFRTYLQFVTDMGFTIVNACYPMSDHDERHADSPKAIYAASSRNPVVSFSTREKLQLFRAFQNMIPEFRPKIRLFTPRSALHALQRQYAGNSGRAISYPCRGGIDFFFVSCKDAGTYPCGYRGSENLGKYPDFDPGQADPGEECYRCDWECFRDPSELLGPLLHGAATPFVLLKNYLEEPVHFRLWAEDLRYYRACGLFDGRKPPDYERLRCFLK